MVVNVKLKMQSEKFAVLAFYMITVEKAKNIDFLSMSC
jgi:hypothetical protein